ncbi:MAG: hypothetical protein P8H38_04825 [Flavobacteriaceae bacterium]|nr:hypothetical protein [Flavobacteriaceae bacterium]
MKAYKSIIFLFVMLLLAGGVSWFSYLKNKARTITKVEIKFTHPSLLLDTLLVNKLLTQNLDEQSKQFKDSLDLNMLETQLKRTPEVKNIEVYILPQGGVSVEVTERKPLFEVAAERRFFGDAEGVLFEYQVIDSLKLPVFEMDSTFTSVIPTAKLITKLRNDPLLDMELETIYLRDNEYTLGLRSFPFEVILGDSTQLKQKIEKLKVFCAFQNSQDSLNGYDKINLSYKNQVVAITL